jgi:8-oxo-dGTP diphosphatase
MTPESSHTQPLIVVAAAIIQQGCLLVVSKQAAPELYYLPGGKPEPGERPIEALARELGEELGVSPLEPRFLADIESVAALEGIPMRMTVYATGIDRDPHPAAELAGMRWTSGPHRDIQLAPAVEHHVMPLLRQAGLFTS